jgi:putative SOS response-associated peptidase YedK
VPITSRSYLVCCRGQAAAAPAGFLQAACQQLFVSKHAGVAVCGRYVITSPPEAIRALFGYDERPNFPARYNIAPTQPIPVVRLADGKRQFLLMRWGLIPSWVRDPKSFSLLINARGESVTEKPAFRAAMKRRRCLIPADGFYEWQAGAQAGAPKRPYFIRPASGQPIAFAGIYETWTGPNGEELDTAAIVTTRANRKLAPIHDRMPVVIAPEAFDLWLDCTAVDAPTAAALIAPAPEGLFELYEVSTAVNRTVNDDERLIARLVRTAPPVEPAREPRPPASKSKAAARPKAGVKPTQKKGGNQPTLL